MLAAKYQVLHDDLIAYARLVRQGNIYRSLPLNLRLMQVGLDLCNFNITYGRGKNLKGGCFLKKDAKQGEPSTYKGRGSWGNRPPGLECAGFVDAACYIAKAEGQLIDYNKVRPLSRSSKIFREAAAGGRAAEYVPSWYPTKTQKSSTPHAAGIWAHRWASGVHVAFMSQAFIEVRGHYPQAGDLVFFMYKDTRAWHVHVGLWARRKDREGLIHSSPPWKYDKINGPKFTPAESDYYLDFLEPQRHVWAEWFGSSIIRLREAI